MKCQKQNSMLIAIILFCVLGGCVGMGTHVEMGKRRQQLIKEDIMSTYPKHIRQAILKKRFYKA